MNPFRAYVAEHTRCDDVQRADLLDDTKTTDDLILLLKELIALTKGYRLWITALNSDHPTYDGGPNGNGHNAGKAADLWCITEEGADAIVPLLRAAANAQRAWTVGLGGSAKNFVSYVTWPPSPFVLFMDNDTDHVHAQCANDGGSGIRPNSVMKENLQ